jgi:hypothetical protein
MMARRAVRRSVFVLIAIVALLGIGSTARADSACVYVRKIGSIQKTMVCVPTSALP